ncbi:hypothetical protein [Gordonia alkanivorans]|uniref:hypothetical protein n=1 Tax=Gordonia alkanivorans TaxID=84096 RepID=UPI0004BBA3A2|nr:hypothetical protein [Gordonia alkanivorans]
MRAIRPRELTRQGIDVQDTDPAEDPPSTTLDPAAPTVTVRITWTETSDHEVVVSVPKDVADNPDNYEFADSLAQLDTDGFQGLTRDDIDVQRADPDRFSPQETFEPELSGLSIYIPAESDH